MPGDFIDERPNVTFWVVGGVALAWNLLGLLSYVNMRTGTPESYAAVGHTPEQIAFISATPEWALSAFAIAVTSGVLASVLLLLRKSWAAPMFVLSILAAVALDIHMFVLSDTVAVLGLGPVLIQALVIAIGLGLIVYSRSARRKGWLT